MKTVYIFLLVAGINVSFGAEANSLSLDDIILQIRESKKLLQSYRANYEFHETRKCIHSKPAMENHTTGTFMIDKERHYFKSTEERGYNFNHSLNDWVFGKSTNGSFSETRKGLFVSEDGKRLTGTIQHFNNHACSSYGPEKYFSSLWGWPLDELLEKIREEVREIKQVDEFKYVIIQYPQAEGFIGTREEFTVDASHGWNLVSARLYRKTGDLKSEYQMDYVNINGIPFLQKADVKQYFDATEPKRLTRSIAFTVDVNTVDINPKLKEEDFYFEFPPGTTVSDEKIDLIYKIPDKLEGVYDIRDDPAINIMLADKSLQESVIKTKNNYNAPNVFEIVSESKDNESNTISHTDKKTANIGSRATIIKLHWKMILFVIFLLALFVLFVVLYMFYTLRRR